jgi:hypothetical protein
MAITTRAGKGSALTHTEMDTNWTDLRDGLNAQVPKTQGSGIKIGPNSSQTWGWHDLQCEMHYHEGDADAPTVQVYRGGIKQHAHQVGSAQQITAHMPHDYAPGTDIYIHAHWSHNNPYVTGGSVTWGWELIWAKGHNQAAFSSPITIVEFQNASTTQYQHMVCEALASAPGGGANLLNTSDIEVDGMLFGRVYLSANDLTVSQGLVPDVFLHTVDIHYQSTNVATKNRAPNFWG